LIFKEDKERGCVEAGKQSSYKLLDDVQVDGRQEDESSIHVSQQRKGAW
jgi:hypothetical protein